MRCFIALPLSARAAAALWNTLASERAELPRARWLSPATFHVTLFFLGELNHQEVETTGAAVESTGKSTPPFEVGYGRLRPLPNRAQPRVVAVEITKGAHSVLDYRERLAATLGVPAPHGAFVPHVTVARIPERLPKQTFDFQHEPLGSFAAEECALFESVRGPEGANYHRIAVARFAGT